MQITDIFKLLGGVGLFLFGMSIMSTGLKNACGDNLQNILECATKNKVVAVFAIGSVNDSPRSKFFRYRCYGYRIC